MALLLIILSCSQRAAASRQTNLFGVQTASGRSLIGVSPVSSRGGGYGYGYGYGLAGYGGYGAATESAFSESFTVPPATAPAPGIAPAPEFGPAAALLPQPAPGLPAPAI